MEITTRYGKVASGAVGVEQDMDERQRAEMELPRFRDPDGYVSDLSGRLTRVRGQDDGTSAPHPKRSRRAGEPVAGKGSPGEGVVQDGSNPGSERLVDGALPTASRSLIPLD